MGLALMFLFLVILVFLRARDIFSLYLGLKSSTLAKTLFFCKNEHTKHDNIILN